MGLCKNIKETKKIAAQIAKKVKGGGLVCLYGDLGSGKTTFVKGMAEALGIDHFSVKSPTYTYIREYPSKKIFHIDLYRLEEVDDLLWQEIEELLENEENIIIIEWADKALGKLPEKRIDINFKYIDGNSREINFENDKN